MRNLLNRVGGCSISPFAIISLSCMVVFSAMSLLEEVREVKSFQRENKPSVIRVYRLGRDKIFIEDKIKGKYVDLGSYLKTIQTNMAEQLKKQK